MATSRLLSRRRTLYCVCVRMCACGAAAPQMPSLRVCWSVWALPSVGRRVEPLSGSCSVGQSPLGSSWRATPDLSTFSTFFAAVPQAATGKKCVSFSLCGCHKVKICSEPPSSEPPSPSVLQHSAPFFSGLVVPSHPPTRPAVRLVPSVSNTPASPSSSPLVHKNRPVLLCRDGCRGARGQSVGSDQSSEGGRKRTSSL